MQITIESADPLDAASLRHWLGSDRDVAGSTMIHVRAGGAETMGALEVMDVVLSNATAVSGLALAFAAWRQSRRPGGHTTIIRPDGQRLMIDGSPDVNADLIIRFLSANGSNESPVRPTSSPR